MIDLLLELSDGRTLVFTEIGASDATAAFYFHGAPGGRLELATLDQASAQVGVRVITLDRAGYGTSTPQPGRTAAWADDVAAPADHLGVNCVAAIAAGSTDMS